MEKRCFYGNFIRLYRVLCGMKVKADDGRIYLPKKLREEFGDEFELIDRGDRLVLVPVPDDPLSVLREEAEKSEKSARELKESGLKQALEEAGQ